MDRRQYLARVAGSGAVAAVAGCLGDDSSGDNRTAADRTGIRALDRAVGQLNEAAIAMDSDLGDLDDVDDPEDVEFDPAEPNERIETAREHLSTAEEELDDDRRADVSALRTYANVLERLVGVTAAITDESLAAERKAVASAIEGDGSIGDAIETVDERNEALAAERERLDAAIADLDSLDADRLAELSVVDLAKVREGAATIDDVLASMETLGAGYAELLDGVESLEEGEADADAENHERARASFEAAASALDAATETFREGSTESSAGLDSSFETALCQSDHLHAAATHFEAAAAAAVDDDRVTADRRRDKGDAALEDAEACS